ncbi:MAG: hypothetical protein RL577_1564 [Bacteroidota bacterium]
MGGAVANRRAPPCAYAFSGFYILVGADPNVVQVGVIRFHSIGVANDNELAVSAGVVLRITHPTVVNAEYRISHLQGNVKPFVQLAAPGPKGRHDWALVRLVKQGTGVEIQTDLKGVASLDGLAYVREKLAVVPALRI